MLKLAFLIGFGIVAAIGGLIALLALNNLRDQGADAALHGGSLLFVLAMIGAAIVLF